MKFDTRTNTALVCALLASAAIIGLAQAVEAPYVGYRITKVQTLPGKNPRWDHMSIDEANRNLFIGRRAEGLTVVNMDTGEVRVAAELAAATKGTNGAWAAPELGIGLS